MANSVDCDHTSHAAMSDLGLNILLLGLSIPMLRVITVNAWKVHKSRAVQMHANI